MEKTAELVEEFAAQVAEVAKQYGPTAMDFALTLGRVDAARHVALTLSITALAIFLVTRLSRVWAWATKNADETDGLSIYGGIGVWIATIFLVAATIIRASNIYPFVGLFKPEIYLAAKALGWI